jgi:tRNA pseudouridine55 synthase
MISGLFNIDKPKGITSHDVVARVRRLSGQRKAGHTGTLDPMATGVLLVCLGQATRLIEYIQAGSKEYRAIIRFGTTTDTLDAEGQIVAKKDSSGLTEAQLRQVLPQFQGEIEQTPPIFSALKRDGQPLYKLARAGQAVEVAPRPVTIETLKWVAWDPPDLTVEVVCSPGTYIRSLARDLGEAVATGAHLAALTRTRNSGWSIAEAVSLDQLERESKINVGWKKYLHPLDNLVSHLSKITVTEETAVDIRHGRSIIVSDQQNSFVLRAYTLDGRLLAILTRVQSDDTLWQPKKVFHIGET